MIAELRSKYGVSTKLGQQWVTERVLLPLMDGLDEVAPERQEKCAQQINNFLTGEAAPLYAVVCSRMAEYNSYQTILQLNGAVYLRELSDRQIQAYLTKVGRQELWQFISHSPDLLDFVRTPLLLSMAVLAYPQNAIEQRQQLQTADIHLQYLLDAYVKQMLDRQFESRAYGKRRPPTPKQTRHWLIWLAGQMEQASQTEFLIEEMQPFMLPASKQKYYRLIWWLISGLISGLIFGLIFGSMGGLVMGLMASLTMRLIIGLMNMWILETRTESIRIEPVEVLKFEWMKFTKNGLTVGLISGLIFGLMFGLLAGLSFGLLFGLMVGLRTESMDLKTRPNQGIERSIINSVSTGLVSWLVSGLMIELMIGLRHGISLGLMMRLTDGLMTGLPGGLFAGMIFGGFACVQYLTLRLLLYQNDCIPWNYARFLNYCTERLLLQRVGGRYRFVHKLLQDHFARMAGDEV
jgi:hypothetical protein